MAYSIEVGVEAANKTELGSIASECSVDKGKTGDRGEKTADREVSMGWECGVDKGETGDMGEITADRGLSMAWERGVNADGDWP